MKLPRDSVRLTVGITGHRDLVAGEAEMLEAQTREFLQGLQQRFPGLPLQILTPLAEGGDQLVARVALRMEIPVVAVLPFQLDEYRTDFSCESALAEFERLLGRAERVIELPWMHGEMDDGVITPLERDRQYAQVGVFISNHCQILLALWDGKPAQAVGGTAHIVSYHLTTIMQGFEDQQSSAQLLADNENDLAFHLVCSRDRPGGKVAAGLRPGQVRWLTSQGVHDDPAIPGEYGLMLDRLQLFESDRRRHAPSSGGGAEMLDAGLPGREAPESARFVECLFADADRLAIHYQAQVNRGLYGIYSLAAMMGLVFIIYSEYSEPHWLLWLFLGMFFAGVALHATGSRREWHRKYLDYRALAEALRVQFYWHLAGVVEARSVVFAYENFLQKQDVELGWIRHVMRASSLLRSRSVEPDPEWVSWVVDRWVGKSDGGGQLAYYSRKEHQNSRNFRRTELLGTLCLWSGIAIALALAIFSSRIPEQWQHVLLIFTGILPLIAGIRDTVSHKRAEKELIKQYRFMAQIFRNARRLLDSNGDVVFQRRVLKALGEAALEEGAEWILMHRARPLEHQGLS